MPSTLIGLPGSGQKQLQSFTQSTDVTGLVRMTETYTIRLEDAANLTPAKGVRHFTWSTATTPYAQMVVEETSVALQAGDLATLSVTYVGVTNQDLPKPYVRILPGVSADAPIKVEITFLALAESRPCLLYPVGGKAPRMLLGYELPRLFTGSMISRVIPPAGEVYVWPLSVESVSEDVRGLFSVVRVLFSQVVTSIATVAPPAPQRGVSRQPGEGILEPGRPTGWFIPR